MAPPFRARVQLLLLRAVGFLIGLIGQAARAFGGPKFGSRTTGPVNEPLLLLSAIQLAKLIRQRKVKCIDVVQAYINRIKDVNPMINGIVKYRFEAAKKEAYAVDQRLSEKLEDESTLEKEWPFLGVPLTVKEAFQLQGGEGCTLAAACSVIGVGSDIGGSIRMPAFFNGIFGHKPSPGVVSNQGQFPMAGEAQEPFQCTGPMCRYAEDLIPMLRVMAGPGIKKLKLDAKVHLQHLKFYWMEHDGGSLLMSKVDQDLILAQRKVVAHLENILGASVQHVKLKEMKYSFQLWITMMSTKGHDGKEPVKFVDLLGDHGKPINPLWELIKWCLGLSVYTIPSIGLALFEEKLKYNQEKYKKFKAVEESLHKELVEMLGDDGVFLYPSHPTVAPKHHVPLTRPFNFAYTGVFNALGLPVTQCPLGLNAKGLPVGIQVVAGPFNDHLTLAVAQYLEKSFGGWVCPGKV
ncbi:fatty acid amide hydrolase 2, transcript variant X2 [Ictidomys tridecemlineatus]|uniref:fatty-acid amide hydrolase 2 isoform X4 n=1 Tax=Ictidomys tridecemlineatus TaxID=43179 RepID=UPI000B5463AE|nr:fatty-acid amide hydrolase 2 isoform X4 [Ictidomys tridecemlineatus]KAG3272246.1 fatty acid amide hydrolase 2, transcript variant X2 [Ictidomys tridecemlineatus]